MSTPASPPPSAEHVKAEFFLLGLHYYVSARQATFAQLFAVCGNLFHLKGGLTHLGLKLLKKEFGHDLLKAWAAFKAGDTSLDRFDPVIASLDQFERIKYPDEIVSKGLALHIDLHCPPGDVASSSTGSVYHLCVQELDDLVKAIVDKASVDPRFFTASLNLEAREALERSPKTKIV